jgi:hypothetical protein
MKIRKPNHFLRGFQHGSMDDRVGKVGTMKKKLKISDFALRLVGLFADHEIPTSWSHCIFYSP